MWNKPNKHFAEYVVVTGAAGFVGSVMCTRLSEYGYNVIALDNNVRGLNDNKVKVLPNVLFIEKDCSAGIGDILKQYSVTDVIHFAAATGDLTRSEEELNEINVGMTQRIVMDMCSHDPYITLTFPTTSLSLAVPDSTYVKSKEAAIKWLVDESPLSEESRLLYRFFNNAGGYHGVGEFRNKEVHAFPRLFRSLMKEEKFIINGMDYDTVDGTPARDFIHVVDSVDFMIYRLNRASRYNTLLDSNGILCEVGRGDPKTVIQCLDTLMSDSVKMRLLIPNVDNLLKTLKKNIVIGPRRDFDCGSLSPSPDANIFKWRSLKSFEDVLVDSFNGFYQFYKNNPSYLDKIIPNPAKI